MCQALYHANRLKAFGRAEPLFAKGQGGEVKEGNEGRREFSH
jgi:hypothetical protein